MEYRTVQTASHEKIRSHPAHSCPPFDRPLPHSEVTTESGLSKAGPAKHRR